VRHQGRIFADRDTPIEYDQFNASLALRFAMRAAGVLTWPIVLPLALLSRLSDFVFLTASQLLAFVPYVFGTIVRYEFYRFALRACGKNVMIGFGSVFLYRDVEVGDNVLIGMYNTIHHCDIRSYTLTAEGCRFLSGARYHHFATRAKPMALQGGALRRITVGPDAWIGANAVVMSDVREGAIVAAGAVVTQVVEPYSVVGGVPAKRLRERPE
jgi:acetyltransferase-like isoleucine patch superfamily enzyme